MSLSFQVTTVRGSCSSLDVLISSVTFINSCCVQMPCTHQHTHTEQARAASQIISCIASGTHRSSRCLLMMFLTALLCQDLRFWLFPEAGRAECISQETTALSHRLSTRLNTWPLADTELTLSFSSSGTQLICTKQTACCRNAKWLPHHVLQSQGLIHPVSTTITTSTVSVRGTSFFVPLEPHRPISVPVTDLHTSQSASILSSSLLSFRDTESHRRWHQKQN